MNKSIEELREFWTNELSAHFRAEEKSLFPIAASKSGSCKAEVETALQDHRELTSLFFQLTGDIAKEEASHRLADFAERLIRHIRFEESVLFVTIERELSDAELNQVGQELAARSPSE